MTEPVLIPASRHTLFSNSTNILISSELYKLATSPVFKIPFISSRNVSCTIWVSSKRNTIEGPHIDSVVFDLRNILSNLEDVESTLSSINDESQACFFDYDDYTSTTFFTGIRSTISKNSLSSSGHSDSNFSNDGSHFILDELSFSTLKY